LNAKILIFFNSPIFFSDNYIIVNSVSCYVAFFQFNIFVSCHVFFKEFCFYRCCLTNYNYPIKGLFLVFWGFSEKLFVWMTLLLVSLQHKKKPRLCVAVAFR